MFDISIFIYNGWKIFCFIIILTVDFVDINSRNPNLRSEEGSTEPKVISVDLDDESCSHTGDSRNANQPRACSTSAQKPKQKYLRKVMRVEEIERFNNSDDYQWAENCFSPSPNMTNELISPNYMSSKKSPNFVIAPGLRTGKNGILEKLSPRSKTGRGNIAYLTSENEPGSPAGKKSNKTMSSNYVTQMKHHNQEIDQITKERMKKDYSMNFDSNNSSMIYLKTSNRSPNDLRKSKSTKRGIIANKSTIEFKHNNIYTSNGFTLGFQSPKHKDHINSTMVKIEKTYVLWNNLV